MAGRSTPQGHIENRLPLPGGPEPAVKRPVLWLDAVCLSARSGPLLHAADALFGAGELALVETADRASAALLAELLTGRREAESGRLRRAGAAAPLIPSDWGFEPGTAIEDGLGLRAAACGLDRRGFVDAVAGLLDRRDALDRSLPEVAAEERAVVTFASGYLVPAPLYIVLGAPLPEVPAARRRLEPLLARARRDAAVICIAARGSVGMGQIAFDRRFMLADGKLVGCTGDGLLTTPAGPNEAGS